MNEFLGDGFKHETGPAGVPNSACLTKDTDQGRQTSCYVSKDRYVGEIDKSDDKTAKQEATAQYMIFQAAEH